MYKKNESPPATRPSRLWLLRPFAGRLLVLGHILLFLSLGFFAAMFCGEGHAEALLYLDTYMASVGGSAAVLWGVVLAVDWLDRVYSDEK